MNEILIVEDESTISNLIKMALEKHGYSCDCAFDGESGADMVERKRYDLILLDVMLPIINGFELIEYIKDFNTPVIFITAKSDVNSKVKGLNLGADDYITKPFDISELQARVDAVLRRYNKTSSTISIGNICINTDSRIVTKNGTADGKSASVSLLYAEFYQDNDEEIFKILMDRNTKKIYELYVYVNTPFYNEEAFEDQQTDYSFTDKMIEPTIIDLKSYWKTENEDFSISASECEFSFNIMPMSISYSEYSFNRYSTSAAIIESFANQ